MRTVSNFEFELQLARMGRKVNDRTETIFRMPEETFTVLS